MDERILRYILESHVAWKPDKLALTSWEVGISSVFQVRLLIKTTKQAILMGMNNDSNDAG